MWPAIVAAFATLVVSAGTFFLTKQKEREAVWRAKKLSYYEAFFGAASGIVGPTCGFRFIRPCIPTRSRPLIPI